MESVPGALSPLKQTLELSAQYGISMVLCLIVMGILVWVLRWVFKTSAARELAMSNIVTLQATATQKLSDAIQSNTNSLNTISTSMREGFERLYKADDYHRNDIADLSKRVDASCKAG